ncbi:MAG: tRNA lysidine(34) synthetase TilS [Thermodesulfovibrionia bacterium]|nr:tRNA lysidine(34) synthetase TilS [Thermodesulfovibrionia bacterium]
MELLKKVKETINKYSMLSEGDNVIIGLSGGPDSVCLGIILHKLRVDFNLTLNAVYIDHGLRPDEVENEKAFCKDFCNNFGIGFFTKAIDVKKYAKDRKLNLQEAARELRYHAYEEVSKKAGAAKIALGHTADDQTETFFMMLLRGSGMKGLSGIPPVRGKIIRPLIEIERKEIEEFFFQNSSLFTLHSSLPFIVDSSNLKKDYFRNWIRLMIIPEFKKKSPALVKSISRMADILREEDAYLEIIVTKTLMRLISRKSADAIELFLSPLETMGKPILRRILRRAVSETEGLKSIDFIHIEDMIELIKRGKSGDRVYLPKGIRVIKNYSTMVITSRPPQKISTYTINVPGEVVLNEIKAVIKASAGNKSDDYGDGKITTVFDADKIGTVLTVRPRENGDFFYPSGFGKRKKLQDFFVDEKVPRDERDSIPIVVSGNDIVWVAGFRGDERFKAAADTKRFLKLEFNKVL